MWYAPLISGAYILRMRERPSHAGQEHSNHLRQRAHPSSHINYCGFKMRCLWCIGEPMHSVRLSRIRRPGKAENDIRSGGHQNKCSPSDPTTQSPAIDKSDKLVLVELFNPLHLKRVHYVPCGGKSEVQGNSTGKDAAYKLSTPTPPIRWKPKFHRKYCANLNLNLQVPPTPSTFNFASPWGFPFWD